jgi:hypothetical protein
MLKNEMEQNYIKSRRKINKGENKNDIIWALRSSSLKPNS